MDFGVVWYTMVLEPLLLEMSVNTSVSRRLLHQLHPPHSDRSVVWIVWRLAPRGHNPGNVSHQTGRLGKSSTSLFFSVFGCFFPAQSRFISIGRRHQSRALQQMLFFEVLPLSCLSLFCFRDMFSWIIATHQCYSCFIPEYKIVKWSAKLSYQAEARVEPSSSSIQKEHLDANVYHQSA